MTAYYNDIDPFCCEVLRKHIAAGDIPPGDVDERDIKTVDAEELKGYDQIHLFAGIGGFPYGLRLAGWPDDKTVITGGPPCQPVSFAGKGLGDQDERWLWPEFFRVIRDLRWRRYVLAENPTGLFDRGFGYVLGSLAEIGLDAAWDVVSAADVGAPHKRERVWIIANADSIGHSWPERLDKNLRAHREGRACVYGPTPQFPDGVDWEERARESAFCRANDGVPHRVDRIRALGNAVVPQCVALVARMILETEAAT